MSKARESHNAALNIQPMGKARIMEREGESDLVDLIPLIFLFLNVTLRLDFSRELSLTLGKVLVSISTRQARRGEKIKLIILLFVQ